MAGTKNIEEVCLFVISLTEAVATSLEDGKITITDSFNFVDTVQLLGPAMENIDLLPAELMDLTDEEVDQIAERIKTEFDIENDVLEETIEDVIEVALKLTQLIGKFI